MANYIIAIDRDGQPYIAHASDSSKRHKYLVKIPNYYKDGRALYLYTKAEVRAYNKRGKPSFSNRIRDRLGWDERSARDDAKKRYEQIAKDSRGNEEQKRIAKVALDKAEENYSQTWLGKKEASRKKHLKDTIAEVRVEVKTEAEKERTARANIKKENERIRGQKTQRWFDRKFK